MQRLAAAAFAGAVLAGVAIPAAAAQAAPGGVTVSVVRSGLNNPRHLTETRAGLFVAEAGAGGPSGTSNCVTGPATGGTGTTKYCVGDTGAVALIRHRHIVASVSLPSVIEADTGEVAGPGAVAFSHGQSAVVMQDVLVNSQGGNSLPKPAGYLFGKLLIRSGHRVTTANLAAYAAAHPQPAWSLGTVPGETAYDSDPYDVVAYHGGFVVADAAANSLLQVSASGHIRLLARFPAVSETAPAGVFGPTAVTVKAQAVPTSVAVGPDGAFYVGLLRGVPSDPGTAYIYRVVPGQQPVIWARGLTAVTAIAFDGHGRLLATEYSTGGLLAPPTVPGALVRISHHGHTVTTLPVSGLFQPTGVAVGSHGTVYVSNYGDSVATAAHPGEILAITGLS
ncbi:MAG: ScyD/ScyE family protein [Streptosporangiaceae bacterium]